MTYSRLIALCSLGLLPLLAACASSAWHAAAPGHRVVYVALSDLPDRVRLGLNDELVVRMPTASSGRWELLQRTEPVLVLQPNTLGTGQMPHPGGVNGAVYTFRAASAGVELVSFTPRASTIGGPFTLLVEVAVGGPPADRP